MNNELKDMLKKITHYDLIIGIIVTIVLLLICPSYSYVFLAGIILASMNFNLNGIINNYILGDGKKSVGIIVSLLYISRILIISFIGALLYKINSSNVYFYIAGFCSHFISMIIYTICTKH